VRKVVQKYTNKDELWESVKKNWNNLDREVIRNLYLSMKERVTDLKKAKGGYTRW
jgi:DNA repair protein RadC